MANITKITAKDPNKPKPKAEKNPEEPKQPKQPKEPKDSKKAAKKVKNQVKSKDKKPFILFRPFCAIGRYFRDSWKEIRQVRWPSRKATWKMLFAVLVYTAFFMVLIVLLDALFTYLFNLIIA